MKFTVLKSTFLMMAGLVALVAVVPDTRAQTAPSAGEASAYVGLHSAAQTGDVTAAKMLIAQGVDLEQRDHAGRTPLIIAAYASHEDLVTLLADAGADVDALEHQAYDIVTIAAVANDLPMLELALQLGADPGQITSPYEGTALIAAAHLGHHEVVGKLIDAGAPLDHVNNLHWTALIEAVVLGNGGTDHVETVRLLVDAGADASLTDRQGITALELARARGYASMVSLLSSELR